MGKLRKMNIGFDSKWYFEGPISGKMVVKNLLKTLMHNGKHLIIPIFRYKDKDKVKAEFGDIDCIYSRINNPFLSNVFEVPFLKKTQKMDLIIFQNFSPFFGRFKKINYIHDIIFEDRPDFFTLLERVYFYPIKYLSKKADLIITISKHEKERILRKKYSKNVEYIYHGVDNSLHSFSDLDIKKIKLPEKYILAVGRLNIRKNIATLVKSFASINDKDIKLVIVGEKSWKSEEVSIEDSVKSRIVFFQNISNQELGLIYSNAHIFCFLSIDEGFGLPIIEAMSFGIPTILSNCSVMPEVGKNAGIKVNPMNTEDIIKSINSLMSNESIYMEQKSLSIDRSKFFSWEEPSKKLIKLCEKLC